MVWYFKRIIQKRLIKVKDGVAWEILRHEHMLPLHLVIRNQTLIKNQSNERDVVIKWVHTLGVETHRVLCWVLRNFRLKDKWARGFEHNKMDPSTTRGIPPYPFERLDTL
jgi:hypothetical protein